MKKSTEKTKRDYLKDIFKFVLKTTPEEFKIEDVLKRVEELHHSTFSNSSNKNS